ncbi:Hypothetical predicted protein [Marmota monax]|uniref:Uncharacterized protein n=1 Tax=Marmota monax TaxID=9995 RepID=A0A5E4AU37_MARMO|nr:hypothetical protein GHT09_016566 [Marmota monax]VTJ60089.1 Hypothetical predicted protein [Marmota monax]
MAPRCPSFACVTRLLLSQLVVFRGRPGQPEPAQGRGGRTGPGQRPGLGSGCSECHLTSPCPGTWAHTWVSWGTLQGVLSPGKDFAQGPAHSRGSGAEDRSVGELTHLAFLISLQNQEGKLGDMGVTKSPEWISVYAMLFVSVGSRG